MASMTIRNLDDRVKTRLRVRAAEHGRSMEDEAREILASALAEERPALAISMTLSGPGSRPLAAWNCLRSNASRPGRSISADVGPQHQCHFRSAQARAGCHGSKLGWNRNRPRACSRPPSARPKSSTASLCLPEGCRQSILLTAAVLMFEEDFRGRVLPFDSDAPQRSMPPWRPPGGKKVSLFLSPTRRSRPHPSRGGRLATRNVRDFAGCGIEIVNPRDA